MLPSSRFLPMPHASRSRGILPSVDVQIPLALLLSVMGVLVSAILALFKLLSDERKARLEFVERKLGETELRESTHKAMLVAQQDMLQKIMDVTKAQMTGALPPPR